MATRPFYNTQKWRKKRTAILKRDSYLCQECKRYGKTTEASPVHHVIPLEWCLDNKPELALASKNLLSMCFVCHNRMDDRFIDRLSKDGLALVKRIYGMNTPEGWSEYVKQYESI